MAIDDQQPENEAQPQQDGAIGGEFGIQIDETQVVIIRHPDNAHLATGNDIVRKKDDEQPSDQG